MMTEVKRLFDFPYYQLENFKLEKSLVTKYGDDWIATSTEEYIAKANKISRALLRLGINRKDNIAIISTSNRTEWNIMDIGILQTGAQDVPIYPSISEDEYAYVLNHSESKYCFVSDKEVLDKVNKVKDQIPSLKEIYSFDDIKGTKSWKELLELGEDDSNQEELDSIKAQITEEDLATIIYTSGTTGKPKGVIFLIKI